MTTNVYDVNARKLASDSRWSINTPNFVAFVDNTGFDKIFVRTNINLNSAVFNIAVMFAGNGQLIQQWKDWLSVDEPDLSAVPNVEDSNGAVVLCMVNTNDSSILFERGQDISLNDIKIAGSGSEHAYTCWNVNRSPCRAIESAMKLDLLTGGEVKFFDFSKNSDNLQNTATIHSVHQEFLKRGEVMYKLNPSMTVSVQDAAKNDAEVKALVNGIVGGKVSAGAPCDSMHNPWSKEKIEELHTVLHKVFGKPTSI